MNDYEQERLANIAKNEALLKEIGLTGIKPPKPRPTTPAKRSTPRKRNIVDSEPVVRRTSSRLSGIPVDSAEARRKAEEHWEAAAAQERIKKARIEGPIDLSSVIENNARWDDAKSTLISAAETIKSENGDARDTAPITEETKELKKQFAGLSLLSRWEPNRIKITPERIYSMEMHPGDKKLAFAGDKLGCLGLWDVESSKPSTRVKDEDEDDAEPEADPMIHHFKIHTRTITAMMFDAANASKLYTSSYDGSVRCLDLASGVASEVFASDSDQAITGLQAHPEGNVVFFSTLEGQLGIRDLRASQTHFYDLHERKIGALGMHPQQPQYLFTSSLDRTMRVWDSRASFGTRSLKSPKSVAEHIAKLSISSAFVNNAGSIVATSYDDSLKVFHQDTWMNGGEGIEPDVVVKHNNTTGRWLTVFKAAWQKNPADGVQKFVVGNMARKMDVFDAQGQSLTQLENEYITAVPAVVAMHPSQNWVIGGNASGKALFFS